MVKGYGVGFLNLFLIVSSNFAVARERILNLFPSSVFQLVMGFELQSDAASANLDLPRGAGPESGLRLGGLRHARSIMERPWNQLGPQRKKMLKEHRGAIYSLPATLIDVLQEMPKKAGAKFFTQGEESLERELSRVAGNGFVFKNPFGYPMFPIEPEDREPTEADKRQHQLDESIEFLMEQEMAASGRTRLETEAYFAASAAIAKLVDVRRAAYAGWLVTNPHFREELARLYEVFGEAVKSVGRFPQLPKYIFRQQTEYSKTDNVGLRTAFSLFYRRWSIDRLITWDLPVPMDPQLVNRTLYRVEDLDVAGTTLFVPWYLRRDEQLKIAEVLEASRIYSSPNHLAAWLDKKPKNLGMKRYGLLLQMCICLEFVLERRYPNKLVNRIEDFDRAFDIYAADGADRRKSDAVGENAKKLRMEMRKLLRST